MQNSKPKIGLALGSGSARGLSHIGVIRELHAMGIKPDIIAGTSAGAIIGAAFVTGQLDWFEEWVMNISRRDVALFLDTHLLVKGGLVEGKRFIEYLRENIGDINIEEMEIPFGSVATNLETGEENWITKGPLWDAVRASMALPGLFTPGRLDGQWMVDGGLVNPVPVSLCRAMGADKIIAVNLNHDILQREALPVEKIEEPRGRFGLHRIPMDRLPIERMTQRVPERVTARANQIISQYIRPRIESPSLQDVFLGSIHIMQDRITRQRIISDAPDIILQPELNDFGVLDVYRAEEAIQAGRECVRASKISEL